MSLIETVLTRKALLHCGNDQTQVGKALELNTINVPLKRLDGYSYTDTY